MTSITNPDIDLEIQKLSFIFKRRWKIGVGIVISSLVLSTIAAIQTKPQHEAVAKLLFKNSRASELTGIKENIDEFESLEVNANPIVSEIEVIKSIPVVQKTIADLDLTDSSGEALEPKTFLAKLETNPLPGSDVVAVAYQNSDPNLALNVVDRLVKNYIDNSKQISKENVTTAVEMIDQQLPKAQAQVVDRKRALQQFQEQHQIFLVGEEAQSTVGNMRDLSQQIEDATSQLQEVRVRTQELEGQIGMDSQRALTLNKLSHSPAIQQDIANLQAAQSKLLTEQERYYDNHPAIASVQNQIAVFEDSLQQRIFKIAGTSSQFFLEDLLASDRENLPQKLTSELAESEIQEKKLVSKLNNLKNVRQATQRKFARVPQLLNEFEDLQLQLETAQSKYKFLLDRAQELSLLKQQNFDNVRIVESAQLNSPDLQSASLLTIGVGSFIGILVAISTMATVDLTDKLIKTPEELERIFKCRTIGNIPNFDHVVKPIASYKTFQIVKDKFALVTQRSESDDSQLLVQDTSVAISNMLPVREFPHSISSEAFWMLQAKFKLLDKKRNLAEKVFVLSSSVSQEGKSTVTANLALALSRLGQKILIVDGNLRNPAQLDIWSGKNSIGLSEIIMHQRTADSATVPIAENLDLISTGSVYSNPLEIINSPKMKHLLQDLAHQYDFVLIDSPALNDIPDALSWANLADGMILVNRLGTLDYRSANKCKELLEIAEVNLVGLVVNNSN